MKPILKKFIAALTTIVLLLVIAVNGVLVWVATGPRSLDRITPYIEAALTPQGANFKVKINETLLIWDGWRRPIDIRIKQVEMVTGENVVFAAFPEISVGVHIPSLLLGRIVLSDLSIKSPILSLYQQENGTVGLGFGGNQQSSVSVVDILQSFYASDGNGHINSIVVDNADLSLGNAKSGVLVTAPKINVKVTRSETGLLAAVEINAKYKDQDSRLLANISWHENEDIIQGKLHFTNVLPTMILEFLPRNSWLDGMHLPLDGIADIRLKTGGNIDSVSFDIKGQNGEYTYKEKFPKPLVIKQIEARGTVAADGNDITIEKLSVQFDKPSLEMKAMVVRPENKLGIQLEASASDMPIDELYKYWPTDLYPISRQWVTDYITDGTVPKATAIVDIKPGDIKEDGSIPEDAFKASVHVKGATVEYLPGYPKITGVNGIANFTGKGMFIDAQSGNMLSGTKLKAGKVVIADLFPAEPIIDLKLDVFSPARDVLDFIALLKLKMADTLALNAGVAGGGAAGRIHLNLPLLQADIPDDQLFDHVRYSIDADLQDVSQPGFMKVLDVSSANGKLGIDNKKITLVGDAVVNDVAASINLTSQFNNAGDVATTHYTVKAPNAPTEALSRFGYSIVPGLTGSVALDATIDETGNDRISQANIDLTKANVEVSAIGYKKPAGVPASVTIEGKESASLAVIKSFNFQSDALKAAGSAVFKSDFSDLSKFNLLSLKHGKNDFSMNYSAGAVDKLTLKGRGIDLAGYFGGKSRFSTKDYRSMEIELAMEKMWLAGGKEASNMVGMLACDKDRCNTANIGGQLSGNKPFLFRIYSEGGKRRALLTAENAGDFVEAFNINHNIGGGKLRVEGEFEDDKPGRPLIGKLLITDYKLTNAPVLTRILTIASLSGVLNTLSGGSGIPFAKMSMPFTLADDIVTIKDGKAYGDALGVTVDGKLSVGGDMLDLKGTLVPSYTLNTVFSRIPIVGILAGGEGQGLFAANYSVKGSHEVPEISVNPLSILAPGFLRGLFDLPDTVEEKEKLKDVAPVDKKTEKRDPEPNAASNPAN